MKYFLLLFVTLFIYGLAYSQKELELSCDVKPVSSKLIFDGRQLFYSLPKNLIRVELEIKKTIRTEGPYSGFALKFLNIAEGTIQVNEEYYSIASTKITRLSQPDSSKYYAVSYEGTGSLPMLQLNADGVLISCNSNELITGYEPQTGARFSFKPEPEAFVFIDLGIKPFWVDLSEQANKANKDDSMLQAMPLVPANFEPATIEQNAEAAADFIRKLRKRRQKLIYSDIAETHTVDGDAVKIMIEQLDLYEQKYLELFTGKTIESSSICYFDFEPSSSGQADEQVIAWFSRSKGLELEKPEVRKSDFQPLVLSAQSVGKVPNTQIAISETKQKTSNAIKYGLFYRIPGKADVVIKYMTQILIQQQVEIAQKGQVMPMPVDYLNNPNYAIELYPETGALKRIYRNK